MTSKPLAASQDGVRRPGCKFVFITGGVVSSLGKGVSAAAVGALLQARGLKARLRKFDPYLNVDPGTMNPFQHGEVYITADGAETDLDLGHYERFTGVASKRSDSVTAGQIYARILNRERRGDFLGDTVQVIPHVTDAIKEAMMDGLDDEDVVVCEIGGTVGDIESLPFLEAIRQLRHQYGADNTLFLHLTLVPWIEAAGELKTKPTQHSVKELQRAGIQPDVLLCRCERDIDEALREKISLFCNVPKPCVIQAADVETVYRLPLDYHQQGLDQVLCHRLKLETRPPDLGPWRHLVACLQRLERRVTVAVVGKYTNFADCYKSLVEALTHGGIRQRIGVDVRWLDAEVFTRRDVPNMFAGVDAIMVPGGFGERGSEGKIAAARYAREHAIPYFGICLGMQMAVLEVARNLAGIEDAGSTEFAPCKNPVVGLLHEWRQGQSTQRRSKDDNRGGTMRLGSYECVLEEGSRCRSIYDAERISERHRHRYEINTAYETQLRRAGMFVAGRSPDGRLPEIVEMPSHPWFVGVQFHPEIRSRPLQPHPLFCDFIRAATRTSQLL